MSLIKYEGWKGDKMKAIDDEFLAFAKSRATSLHRAAYLLCGDWHTADDVTQETLTKAYRNWSRVQRADSPDAYVRRILINESHRQSRRLRKTDELRIVRQFQTVDSDRVEEQVNHSALLEGLLALPARQRATVVLRYLEGLSEREAAAALHCSIGTVKSQTSRALHALRTYFNDDREELSL
jgi:RNA polymerase sigma-70 factor (sigma-E family)